MPTSTRIAVRTMVVLAGVIGALGGCRELAPRPALAPSPEVVERMRRHRDAHHRLASEVGCDTASGLVFDGVTGAPVVGVRVRARHGRTLRDGWTDSIGRYVVALPARHGVVLEWQKDGFEPFRWALPQSGHRIVVELNLRPADGSRSSAGHMMSAVSDCNDPSVISPMSPTL